MQAYKLVRLRKDGTYGSLFIGRGNILPRGMWLQADSIPTKGYALRPGWHCTMSPEAPHLSRKGRVWVEVEIESYEEISRPKSQGGVWLVAKRMKIKGEINA